LDSKFEWSSDIASSIEIRYRYFHMRAAGARATLAVLCSAEMISQSLDTTSSIPRLPSHEHIPRIPPEVINVLGAHSLVQREARMSSATIVDMMQSADISTHSSTKEERPSLRQGCDELCQKQLVILEEDAAKVIQQVQKDVPQGFAERRALAAGKLNTAVQSSTPAPTPAPTPPVTGSLSPVQSAMPSGTTLDDASKKIFVPFPIYLHDKEPGKGTVISQAFGNDLLGDSLEPTEHGMGDKKSDHQHGEGHAAHGYLALLVMFACLCIGSLKLWFLERFAPQVPYTCVLFVGGFIVAVLDHLRPETNYFYWSNWHHSINMWQGINPHLLFFTFLPALLFGEAMTLNVQLVKKCFAQIFILACPGVLLGTVLTAVVGKYVLPYNWDWPIAMVFGSILSATDPVAVVALFNTLGVSPRLTMLISGESLLNDGTAMVLFALFLKISAGAEVSPLNIIEYFTHMTLTAVILGAAVGMTTVYLVGRCAEENYHSDSMIQVVFAICCGYLTFFFAESELSTSGVLATVAAGVVFANSAWPRIVSRETMYTIWEAIEFIGNTLIFFIAGLIFGGICASRSEHITLADYGYLLLLYVIVTGIRALMIVIFWWPLNKTGTPIVWQEVVVMVWSGLRGAVGLAMAIIVDLEPNINHRMGSRVMFHVGGIAALTTLLNASTTSKLLSILGLTKTPTLRARMIEELESKMLDRARALFETQMQTPEDIRFDGANADMVLSMVPSLTKPRLVAQAMDLGDEAAANMEQERLRLYREVFIKVLQNHYWDAIHDGIIGRKSEISRILLDSTNAALDKCHLGLFDWEVVERRLLAKLSGGPIAKILARISKCWPFSRFGTSEAVRRDQYDIQIIYACLSFLDAHHKAQEEVPHFFRSDDEDPQIARVEQYVHTESMRECQRAHQRLQLLPGDKVTIAKSKMLARRLLNLQIDEVQFLKNKGVVADMEAGQLEHHVYAAIRRLIYAPLKTWN